MKRVRRAFAAWVLSLILLLCGCSVTLEEEVLPEATMEKLEEAINSSDIQGILDCMEDDAVDAIEAEMDIILKVTGALTGIKLSDYGITASNLMDLLPLMTMVMPNMELDGTTPVHFVVTKTLIKGSKATVYYTDTVSGQSDGVNMVKEDGTWLLSLDVVPITDEEADRIIISETEEEADVDDAESAAHAHDEESEEAEDGTASSSSGESGEEEQEDAADAVSSGDSSGSEAESSSGSSSDFSLSILIDPDALNDYIDSLD